MAAGSKSNPQSRLRTTLSLLCVFALLLVSVPCAMCAPLGAVHRVTMAASHCDDCCSSAQVASAAKACCAVQTPAAVNAVQALDAAPAGVVAPVVQPVLAAVVSYARPPSRTVHPPLLKTNLRI
jgi:hypothetical protein